MKNPACRLFAA